MAAPGSRVKIWVLLGGGMLGLRSVNKDNCRGAEYGGRAAAGLRLKEEDLGLSDFGRLAAGLRQNTASIHCCYCKG